MEKNKLIIEFEKLDKGCMVHVKGQDKRIPWAQYVEKSMPTIIESLKKEYHEVTDEELADTREQLIKSMAELSDKTVEQVKKDLSKMKGDTNANIAILAGKYIEEHIKTISKKGKKHE